MSAPTVDSRDLAAAAKAGDREAFGELYRLHRDEVNSFLARRVRNRHLAEDLTSTTFEKALVAVSRYEEQGHSFVAWLVTIARNTLADYYRSGHNRKMLLPLDLGTFDDRVDEHAYGVAEPLDPSDHAVNVVMASDVTAVVGAAIALLTPKQRAVVRMRYFDGLTNPQIAKRLGNTPNSCSMVNSRALANLAQIIREDPTNDQAF